MDLSFLIDKKDDFMRQLVDAGLSPHYLNELRRELEWLIANNSERWLCLLDALAARIESVGGRNEKLRVCFYTKANEFMITGRVAPRNRPSDYPIREKSPPAFRMLCPTYRSLAEDFMSRACVGLGSGTIRTLKSTASVFLLHLQNRGILDPGQADENDVRSFFIGEGDKRLRGKTVHEGVSIFLKRMSRFMPGIGRILALMPVIRKRRPNIQFLRQAEVEAVREVIRSTGNGLSLRDRAIATMLLYTGMRSCDVVALRLADINWDRDLISITQKKTGRPLVLPLTATVGNALLAYIEGERPRRGDDMHVFLDSKGGNNSLGPTSVNTIVGKIMDMAGVRTAPGDRRGTHLFRHNFVISNARKDTPRAVISETLGHSSANSIDSYLHADIEALRECGLDVGRFPVAEGVLNGK